MNVWTRRIAQNMNKKIRKFLPFSEMYFSKLSRETSRWEKIQIQLRKDFDSIVAITDYGHIKAKYPSLYGPNSNPTPK